MHMYADNYYPENDHYDDDENKYYSGEYTFLQYSLVSKRVYKYTYMGDTRDADFFCDPTNGDGNYAFALYCPEIFDGHGEGGICWESADYTIKELMWFAV